MRRLLLCLAAFAAAALLPAAAEARTGVCLPGAPGPACQVWFGKVTYIGDGDTLYVRLDGERKSQRVRLSGVQAMEQTVYSSRAARRQGECHSLGATERVENLLKRGRMRVRLAAQDEASRSQGRLRRAVAVKIRGRWRDIGRILIVEGHALWLSNGPEYAWNSQYSWLAQRAASERELGLWDATHCAEGPSVGAPIGLTVNWDQRATAAEGFDGEWIKVRNYDPVNALPLGGWWLRDSGLRRFTFPPETVVPPGGTLTVAVGEGLTPANFHWNLRRPIFDNPSDGVRKTGDGAYLFDPDGDLRAWMMYPCRFGCSDLNAGAIEVTTKVRGRERVDLRNVAAHAVNLDGYRVSSPPDSYTFGPDSVLAPGESLRLVGRGDPAASTRLRRLWGLTGFTFPNRGGRVVVESLDGITIGCDAWGGRSC